MFRAHTQPTCVCENLVCAVKLVANQQVLCKDNTLKSHTFVPRSWMCKKQTSVSHSATESEIISVDAGLRLDGIPALDLRDLVVLVLGNTTQNHDRTGKPVVCRGKNHVHQQSRGMFNVLNNVDLVPSHVQFSHQEASLYVFEDNEAVIKMIIKRRSLTMRYVSQDPQSCP